MPNHVSAYLRLVRTVASIHRELDAMEKRIDQLQHSIVSTPVDDGVRKIGASPTDTAEAA